MVQLTQTTVRQIEHGSSDYAAACALRHAVLRAPLGLSLYDEDPAQESGQRHWGLFNESACLIACAVVVPLDNGLAKLRQMAVAEAYQGQGAGRVLIQAIECWLAANGVQGVVMHARVTAVPFYQKLGYRVTSEAFIEVSIPHVRMEKSILPER